MAELEVLSPLHIGNGNVLGLIDFVLEDERFVKINFDRLAEYCYDKGIDLAKGIEEERFKERYKNEEIFSIEKFLASYRIDYGMFADYQIPLNIGARRRETKIEVREFIKNAKRRPYLPGSSIKGGIRTALLWRVLRDEQGRVIKYCDELMKKRRIKRDNACKDLEKAIFGKNAHEDILRALQISDTEPLEQNNLNVSEIEIIGNPTPIPTYVECLSGGSRAEFSLRINENLLGEKLFEKHILRGYLNAERILKICNEFSGVVIEKQLEYNYKDNTIKFFEGLKGKVERCKENEAILNIGWGSGWYSKTIGLEMEKYRSWDKLRRAKLSLGKNPRTKRFVLKFPKTRRVTIDGLPLGWIKVCV